MTDSGRLEGQYWKAAVCLCGYLTHRSPCPRGGPMEGGGTFLGLSAGSPDCSPLPTSQAGAGVVDLCSSC